MKRRRRGFWFCWHIAFCDFFGIIECQIIEWFGVQSRGGVSQPKNKILIWSYCKFRIRVFSSLKYLIFFACGHWSFSWSLMRTVDHQDFFQTLSVVCHCWNSSRSYSPSCGPVWRPSWCGPSVCWWPGSQSSSWRWCHSGSRRWSWSSPLPAAIETSEVC